MISLSISQYFALKDCAKQRSNFIRWIVISLQVSGADRNQFGYIFVYLPMRVIAVKTLKKFWTQYPAAKQSLLSWYEEAEAAEWETPNQLKEQYRNASFRLNEWSSIFMGMLIG